MYAHSVPYTLSAYIFATDTVKSRETNLADSSIIKSDCRLFFFFNSGCTDVWGGGSSFHQGFTGGRGGWGKDDATLDFQGVEKKKCTVLPCSIFSFF